MPYPRPPEAAALDRWAEVSLAERYSDTLREPVPDELLRLLAEAGRKA